MSKATGKKSGATPAKKAKGRQRRGEPVALKTPDFLAEQADQLRRILPHVFTEGKIDVEKLRAALGDSADERPERYSFNWAGKRQSILELQKPTWATLVADKKESINFDATQNIFIEGENLEVLKLLYKSYFGRVKMISIDPPYNTGGDFVYPDNFTDPKDAYLKITGQKDDDGNLRTSNPESNGRYHSAWLSMMYPRLFLARQLLREDGIIFVCIDDRELPNLRMLMNEVFGEENFLGLFTWQSKKGGGGNAGTVVQDQEYIVCFAKSRVANTLARIQVEAEELDLKDKKGPYRLGRELNKWGSGSRRQDRPSMWFPVTSLIGEKVYPIRNDGSEGRWRMGEKKMLAIVERGDAEFVKRPDGTFIVYEKIRSTDPRFKPFRTWLTDVGTTADGSKRVKELFDGRKVMDFPKPVELLKRLIEMATENDDDIVLDFFAGSCTTAEAVMETNRLLETERRFICVQLPEPTSNDSEAFKAGCKTIAEIGKERIKKAIGQMLKKANSDLLLNKRESVEDLGFCIFKLAPSNFKSWVNESDPTPETLAKAMELFNDPLADGWKPENVIYEVSVKEGFSLTARVEKVPAVKANKIFQVTDAEKDQSFRICLDDELKAATIKELNLKKDDLFICRDVAIDDKAAANLALQCRLKTI